MESESRRVAWIMDPFDTNPIVCDFGTYQKPPVVMRFAARPGTIFTYGWKIVRSMADAEIEADYYILTDDEVSMVESLYPVADRQLPITDSQFPVDAELFPPWGRIRSDLIAHCGQRVSEVDQLDAMTILSLLGKWHRESQGPVESQSDVAIGKPASEKPEQPRPDGLWAPNILRWNGRESEIQNQSFKVLEFMWSREKPARWESLADHLWGINDSSKTESSLKTPIKRANDMLLECGVPWQIGQKSGFVVKNR